MATLANTLNNAKLAPAVETVTCLLDLIRQIIGLIEADLESGISISTEARNAMNAFTNKLDEISDSQMGFFFYDGELCKATITFAVPLKGKNYDEMTLCAIEFETVKDLINTYVNDNDSEYPETIQDELGTFRAFENELCGCLEKIGSVRTNDKEDDVEAKPINLVTRNWLFNSPGTVENVGLTLALDDLDPSPVPVRVAYFMRDDTVTTDQISRIRFMIESAASIDLAITVGECTAGGSISPLSADLADTKAIPGGGSCPSVIEYTYDPPLAITESIVRIDLVNVTNSNTNTTVNVHQLVVNP